MPDALNSTEKVLMLLKAFLPDNSPRGTLEICSQLGMKPATVSRLLSIFKEKGFVKQNLDRKYQLGEVVAALGKAVNDSKTARQLAVMRPQLMRLNNILKENIHLELLSGNNVNIAVVLTGTKPVHVTAEPGTWVGVNATAGSKVIMAFLPQARLNKIVRAHAVLQKRLPGTITKWEALRKQFEKIRRTGLAYDHLEYMDGICGVGAPIFDSTGVVFGAVVIPVPVHRETIIFKKETIGLLKTTARKLSSNLGDMSFVYED